MVLKVYKVLPRYCPYLVQIGQFCWVQLDKQKSITKNISVSRSILCSFERYIYACCIYLILFKFSNVLADEWVSKFFFCNCISSFLFFLIFTFSLITLFHALSGLLSFSQRSSSWIYLLILVFYYFLKWIDFYFHLYEAYLAVSLNFLFSSFLSWFLK